MVLAGDFRNGVTFEMEGNVYRVVEFLHVKPGKGAAFVRTKLKNVMTGNSLEKTFNPSEKFEEAQITIQEMQYLYNDGNNYSFMDTTTYEQVELTKDQILETLPYLKDNMNVKVLSYKEKVFGVEPPTFVELEVTYTEPGIKGSTATGTTKPCTVETGAKFNVPVFVEIGDKVRIDTRTGSYMERV
ncbi:MAG: elongation factor P [Clostridia bacterium]